MELEEGNSKTKKDVLITNRHLSINGDDNAEPSRIVLNGDGRSNTNSPAPSDGETNVYHSLKRNAVLCDFRY